MKTSFADILKQVSQEGEKKVGAKVPAWQGTAGLTFPTKLSTEQCSSEETAVFKAGIVASLGCRKVADLTGGLGVDSWAFSRVCDSILYNEMNTELEEAVKHNFSLLGVSNAVFSNMELIPGGLQDILGDFTPDLIFLDPARRSDTGRKVFLLEDCRPDVLTLKDELLAAAPHILIKLSPMADTSLVARQMGNNVSDVFIVGSAGECKELLILMDRNSHEEYRITIRENGCSFSFLPSEEEAARPALVGGADRLAGRYLFEPGKALMKSGAFNLVSQEGQMEKAGRSTHLYVCDNPSSKFAGLGKWFSIDSVEELSNKSVKDFGKAYPKCEVTSRNLPMTSEQLRKKMGSASGGTAHIFAFRCDGAGKNLLIAATRQTI